MADEKVVEKVQMSDGRTAEFAGKRKMIKTSKIFDDGAMAIVLDFRNGETRTCVLSPALMTEFILHGASQKYGDEIAGVEDVEDQILAIDELHARLSNGEWGIKREASGISGTSILLRALVEHTGREAGELKSWLSEKTPAEKANLRNSSKLFPIVQRLEAEKAAGKKKVDEEGLFAGL